MPPPSSKLKYFSVTAEDFISFCCCLVRVMKSGLCGVDIISLSLSKNTTDNNQAWYWNDEVHILYAHRDTSLLEECSCKTTAIVLMYKP